MECLPYLGSLVEDNTEASFNKARQRVRALRTEAFGNVHELFADRNVMHKLPIVPAENRPVVMLVETGHIIGDITTYDLLRRHGPRPHRLSVRTFFVRP